MARSSDGLGLLGSAGRLETLLISMQEKIDRQDARISYLEGEIKRRPTHSELAATSQQLDSAIGQVALRVDGVLGDIYVESDSLPVDDGSTQRATFEYEGAESGSRPPTLPHRSIGKLVSRLLERTSANELGLLRAATSSDLEEVAVQLRTSAEQAAAEL